jgi:hypothetical protein
VPVHHLELLPGFYSLVQGPSKPVLRPQEQKITFML